jgi:predicted nucleotidyltransferase
LLYKRANIVAKDLDDYIFHENVMVNRGQNEKVFTDIDQAKEWLMGKTPLNKIGYVLAVTDIK